MVLITMTLAVATPNLEPLHPQLRTTVEARLRELDTIPDDRKAQLTKLARWVRGRRDAGQSAKLVFICTHNSRRSHLSQLWAQTAARVYGVKGIETFSGGTEATAFNPRAVAAIGRAGFEVAAKTDGDNPVYSVTFGPAEAAMKAFSKVFSDPANPKRDFAAVMTCSQADRGCPYVPGAAYRIAVPYDDPKAFDGTEREAAAYDERAAQIGREMLYLFSLAR